MIDAYDQVAYWRERGKTYFDDYQPGPDRETQELALAGILRQLAPHTVLDVGCGFGRMALIVMQTLPDTTYLGIDVSVHQVMHAVGMVREPRAAFLAMALEDLPEQREPWDLVLACEFLMHVPPERIEATVARLIGIGRTLVTLDWDQPIDAEPMAHNFLHDYRALLGRDAVHVPISATQGLYVR